MGRSVTVEKIVSEPPGQRIVARVAHQRIVSDTTDEVIIACGSIRRTSDRHSLSAQFILVPHRAIGKADLFLRVFRRTKETRQRELVRCAVDR